MFSYEFCIFFRTTFSETIFEWLLLLLLYLQLYDVFQVFSHITYLLKVNSRNTRTRSEISSKLTIKTPERLHWRCSGFFIVNSELISHLALVFLLLTLNSYLPPRFTHQVLQVYLRFFVSVLIGSHSLQRNTHYGM